MKYNKLVIIIILSVVAIINAAYLTNLAYSEINGTVFCDISSTLSCSSVFANSGSQIFWLPFPLIALMVYPIIMLIALLWYLGKITNHRTILRYLSGVGILFNSYIIFQEAFVIKAFCPLCLICTGIIITIHILTYGNHKKTLGEKFREIIEI